MSYAGFWKRVAAFLIDSVVLKIVSFPLVAIFCRAMDLCGLKDLEILELTVVWFGIALGLLYYAAMESSAMQATLGKRAVGIKVTDLDGNRIGFGRAIGRFVGKILSAILFLIGYIMVAFTEKKQSLHDIMAGCLVVNRA